MHPAQHNTSLTPALTQSLLGKPDCRTTTASAARVANPHDVLLGRRGRARGQGGVTVARHLMPQPAWQRAV
jgi:hypothetical protein